jgi:hypothetical protein
LLRPRHWHQIDSPFMRRDGCSILVRGWPRTAAILQALRTAPHQQRRPVGRTVLVRTQTGPSALCRGLMTYRGKGCLWQRICQWPCQCRLSSDAEFDRIDSRYASVLSVPTAQSVTAVHLLIRRPTFRAPTASRRRSCRPVSCSRRGFGDGPDQACLACRAAAEQAASGLAGHVGLCAVAAA